MEYKKGSKKKFLIRESKDINEISPELQQRAIKGMQDRGHEDRATKWDKHYAIKDLEQFKELPIFDGYIIYGFDKDPKTNTIVIHYGSPRSQQFNRTQGRIDYDNNADKYYGVSMAISRKDARILGKIAQTVNPETKYGKGGDDFKIKGY